MIISMFKFHSHGVIEGVLILLEPSSQVVGHSGGVMDNSKVRIGVRSGVGLGELTRE